MHEWPKKKILSLLSQMFTNCSISCWLAWLLHAVGHVLYSRMRLKIYDYSNMKLFITIKAILLLSSALRMTIYRIYIFIQMNGILQARKEPLRNSWLNKNITQQWLRTSLCWQANCVWMSWAQRSKSKTQWACQHREVFSHCCVIFSFNHENSQWLLHGL